VSRPDRPRTPGLRRALLGLLVLTMMPWPAAAGETTPPPPSLRAALADVRPHVTTPPRPVSAAPVRRSEKAQPTPGTDSPAFFKTRTGVLVLAVAGAGAGYAIYSSSHDRIKSPGKD
jgi:hypothetical protein